MNTIKYLLETPESWLLGIVFGIIDYWTKILVDFYLNKSKKRELNYNNCTGEKKLNPQKKHQNFIYIKSDFLA